jgi:predicted AlkP superfamily pyrophosphatase or phosphodiesterase
MLKFCLFALILLSNIHSAKSQAVPVPKLVVGIVVDQMRWDYLYRYYDRFDPRGGFRRMLDQGFTCENTLIPYTPTYTACGHSTIYTGSVPALSGITGNFWWDRSQMRSVYCTEDKSVTTVGTSSALGKMSPRNMLVTTIGDELRMATNFRSKVVGISMKDRGAILPAGHAANAAYWYDNTTGDFITSTYYMPQLPEWVSSFNSKKWVDKYYAGGWQLLKDPASYKQSTGDIKTYESKILGDQFPYDLTKFTGKDYGKITYTPYGNALTAAFAKAAVISEQLGKDDFTDLLAVSFSSPDYIGHTYGPNSVESEDGFLRLDQELGLFLDFLDTQVGKNKYTVFLSADHGVAHVPEFMQENRLPGGRVFMNDLTKVYNSKLALEYNIRNIIVYDDNYQLALNHPALDSAGIDKDMLTKKIVNMLSADSGFTMVFPLAELNTVPLPGRLREMMNNGYFLKRSGDIQFMLKPNYIDAWNKTGTTHGLWNPYDAHIPLLWYGWGIRKGKTNKTTYMTDIAPTLSALLHIQEPNGNVGKVIEEVLD